MMPACLCWTLPRSRWEDCMQSLLQVTEWVCCTRQLIGVHQPPVSLGVLVFTVMMPFSILQSFPSDFTLLCCCPFTCAICKFLVSAELFSSVFRIDLGSVLPLMHRTSILSIVYKGTISFSVTEGIKSCYGRKRSSWQERCVQRWILRQDKVKSKPWEQRFTGCK